MTALAALSRGSGDQRSCDDPPGGGSFGRSGVVIELRPGSQRVALDLPDASRLLVGMPAAKVVEIVPALYAVCAHAHTYAAEMAIATAEQRALTAERVAYHECIVAMEALREGAIRVCLGWPGCIGESPQPEPARTLLALIPRLRAALSAGDRKYVLDLVDDAETVLAAAVLGEQLRTWSSRRSMSAIEAWASTRATPAARAVAFVLERGWAFDGGVPHLAFGARDIERLADCLSEGGDVDSAVAALGPDVPETCLLDWSLGAQARHALNFAGDGLLRRMLDLLEGLATLPARMRRVMDSPPDDARIRAERFMPKLVRKQGFGLAAVPSPRGILIHAASVDGDRVARYGVLQPTRLNFDATGAAARALGRLAETARDTSTLEIEATLMVQCIDPCVACCVRAA